MYGQKIAVPQVVHVAFGSFLLAGCTFYPPSSNEEGGFQADGSYRLSQSERQQDCTALNGWLLTYLEEHHRLESARRRQAAVPPKTLLSTMSRAGGLPEQTSAHDEVCRNYARIRGYGEEMVSKKCPAPDIDALLLAERGTPATIARTEQGAPAVWGGPRWMQERIIRIKGGEGPVHPETICDE